jgi:hypothetical protein
VRQGGIFAGAGQPGLEKSPGLHELILRQGSEPPDEVAQGLWVLQREQGLPNDKRHGRPAAAELV